MKHLTDYIYALCVPNLLVSRRCDMVTQYPSAVIICEEPIG